jgi:hypothetical protein
MAAPGGSNRITALDVIDLPAPDSPTSPTEHHDALMGAVLVDVDKRERERRARPAVVGVLAPRAARADDVVVIGVPGHDQPLHGRDEVTAVLDEVDRNRRQMLPAA